MNSSGTVTATNTLGADGLISRNTSANGSTFYAFDNQGSTSQRLSSSGVVQTNAITDAFGAVAGAVSTDPYSGYNSQWGYYNDSGTGLQLLGHRFYDQTTGRFINRDPIGYEGGINVYGYCGNGPTYWADPSGFAPPYWPSGVPYPLPFPGPGVSPGPGWEPRGPNFVKPGVGSLHPDPDHEPPIEPHWDWHPARGPGGKGPKLRLPYGPQKGYPPDKEAPPKGNGPDEGGGKGGEGEPGPDPPHFDGGGDEPGGGGDPDFCPATSEPFHNEPGE